MGIHSAMNIQITTNWGWRSIRGVIIILTRVMGEWLTYGVSARVVFEERLGGLFFDGRHSCTEDSFAGHSGLYFGDFFTVSIVV